MCTYYQFSLFARTKTNAWHHLISSFDLCCARSSSSSSYSSRSPALCSSPVLSSSVSSSTPSLCSSSPSFPTSSLSSFSFTSSYASPPTSFSPSATGSTSSSCLSCYASLQGQRATRRAHPPLLQFICGGSCPDCGTFLACLPSSPHPSVSSAPDFLWITSRTICSTFTYSPPPPPPAAPVAFATVTPAAGGAPAAAVSSTGPAGDRHALIPSAFWSRRTIPKTLSLSARASPSLALTCLGASPRREDVVGAGGASSPFAFLLVAAPPFHFSFSSSTFPICMSWSLSAAARLSLLFKNLQTSAHARCIQVAPNKGALRDCGAVQPNSSSRGAAAAAVPRLFATATAAGAASPSAVPTFLVFSAGSRLMCNHLTFALLNSRGFVAAKVSSPPAAPAATAANQPTLLPGCAPRSWSGFLPFCSIDSEPRGSGKSSRTTPDETLVRREKQRSRGGRMSSGQRRRRKAETVKEQRQCNIVHAETQQSENTVYAVGLTQVQTCPSVKQQQEETHDKEKLSQAVAPSSEKEQHVVTLPAVEWSHGEEAPHIFQESHEERVPLQSTGEPALQKKDCPLARQQKRENPSVPAGEELDLEIAQDDDAGKHSQASEERRHSEKRQRQVIRGTGSHNEVHTSALPSAEADFLSVLPSEDGIHFVPQHSGKKEAPDLVPRKKRRETGEVTSENPRSSDVTCITPDDITTEVCTPPKAPTCGDAARLQGLEKYVTAEEDKAETEEEDEEGRVEILFCNKQLLVLNKPQSVSTAAFLKQAELLLCSSAWSSTSATSLQSRRGESGSNHCITSSNWSSSREGVGYSSSSRERRDSSESSSKSNALNDAGNSSLSSCVFPCAERDNSRSSTSNKSTTTIPVEAPLRYLTSSDLEASGAVIFVSDAKDVYRPQNNLTLASAESSYRRRTRIGEGLPSVQEAPFTLTKGESSLTMGTDKPRHLSKSQTARSQEKRYSLGDSLNGKTALPAEKGLSSNVWGKRDHIISPERDDLDASKVASVLSVKELKSQQTDPDTSPFRNEDHTCRAKSRRAASRDGAHVRNFGEPQPKLSEECASEVTLFSQGDRNTLTEAHRGTHRGREEEKPPLSSQSRDISINRIHDGGQLVNNEVNAGRVETRSYAEDHVDSRTKSARATEDISVECHGSCISEGRNVATSNRRHRSSQRKSEDTPDTVAAGGPGYCSSEESNDGYPAAPEERRLSSRRTAKASENAPPSSEKESGKKSSVNGGPLGRLLERNDLIFSSAGHLRKSKRRVEVLFLTEKNSPVLRPNPLDNVNLVYLAIVAGHMPLDLLHCHASICKPSLGCVDFRLAGTRVEGSSCYSIWRPVSHGYYKGGPATLTEIRHIEGPSPVVRLHATCLGFPIIGDTMYASSRRSISETRKSQALSCKRLLLHSWIVKIRNRSEALSASQQSVKGRRVRQEFNESGTMGEQGEDPLRRKRIEAKLRERRSFENVQNDAGKTSRTLVEKMGVSSEAVKKPGSGKAEGKSETDVNSASAPREHKERLVSPACRQDVTVVVAPDKLSQEMSLPPRDPWQSFLFSDSVVMQKYPFFEDLWVSDTNSQSQQDAMDTLTENLWSGTRSSIAELGTGTSNISLRLSQRYSDNHTYWDKNVGY